MLRKKEEKKENAKRKKLNVEILENLQIEFNIEEFIYTLYADSIGKKITITI